MSKRCMGCMELFEDQYEICPHCGYVVGTPAEEPIHLLPGSILQDRYIVGKVLGYGGFGVTYLAWDGKLEQKVAIREYLPAEFSTRMPGQTDVTVFSGVKNEQFHAGLKKFVDEAKRVGKFQNEPGIVKIFDTFEENSTAYIVMEYLEGETLSAYLKREGTVPEDKAVEMLMPVMQSLIHVHEEGLLHRDIAPDNIFLTKSGEAKLIDFGASRYATTSHSRSLTVIVKPGYSPEEQYRSRSDQGSHTDVYSLSATMYKMITGKTPPDAMERRAKYENKNKDILVEPHKLNKSISRGREVAILNAMNVRIEDRTPDIASFINELNADPPAKRRYGKIKKIDVYAWPLWLKVAVPTLLTSIVVFGILLLTGVINFSRYTKKVKIPSNIVRAPFVEGTSYDEAQTKIEGSGELHIKISGNVESDYIAPGTVMFQSPVAGAFLEKNSEVSLLISSGNGVIEPHDGISTIPFFTGDTKEAAIDKCKIAGLGEPQFEEVYDDAVEEGLIVSASKQTGEKVAEGTVITLYVSKGPAPFQITNVVGLEEASAKSILEKQGLIVDVAYDYDSTVPEGFVISQNAAAGEYVKRGDRATIVVSTGEKLIVVPDVVGQTKEDAQKALEDGGFVAYVLENNDDTVPAGVVISQTPGAGTSQKEKTQVTIIVSLGVNQSATPAPQLTSKPAPTLAPKATATPVPTSAPVQGNTPTPAPKATASPTPKPTASPTPKPTLISIPNVVGKTQADAENVLSQAGFVSSVVTEYNAQVAQGVVVSQNPDSSKQGYSGDVVTIVVSMGKERIAPTGITIDKSTATLNVNSTVKLNVTYAPSNCTEQGITWSSSDSKTAKVDNTGLVTAVTPGTVTITGKSMYDSNLTVTCKVTVNALSVTGLNTVEIRHEKGETGKNVSVKTNPTGVTVSWSSSNTSIVKVNPSGTNNLNCNLQFAGRGTTTITATISVNGKTASQSCTVKCYDYTGWSAQNYQLTPVTPSDTCMRAGEADVEVGRNWFVQMDYYLYTKPSERRYFATKQSNQGSLTWHFLDHGFGGTSEGYYVAKSSDGGASPAGWVAVASGGSTSGTYKGKNCSNKTGYTDPSLDGRIFFVVGNYSTPIYEHRYYYRTRSVSCT